MESIHPAAKSTFRKPRALIELREILLAVMIIITLLASTSCRSGDTKPDSWEAAQIGVEKTSPLHAEPDLWKKAVTQLGQNENAVFSSSGNKILFISRDRLAHRQRQLYELNLAQRTERRLTFQDGEVLEVTTSPNDGFIFYTSTTDEIKERPALLYPELKNAPLPQTEIYRIQPDEELHERWTNFAGFDGLPFVSQDIGKGAVVTISRWSNDRLILLRSSVQQPRFVPVLDRSGHSIHSFTTLDRKGWRAWVEENTTSRASKVVWLKRGQKPLEVLTGFYDLRHLRLWNNHEDRGLSNEPTDEAHLLFTARAQIGGPRQAYWLQLQKNCSTILDLGPGEVTSIDLSPDQKSILWTLSQGPNAQVFLDTLQRPTRLCQPL